MSLLWGFIAPPIGGGRGVILFCSRGVRLNFLLRIFNIFLPHRVFYNLNKTKNLTVKVKLLRIGQIYRILRGPKNHLMMAKQYSNERYESIFFRSVKYLKI